jgi:plasmid maintenance system antidote protein VapI
MAVRLSQAFGRTPEGWLQIQMHYDLAQINQRVERIQVAPFRRPETEIVPASI